MKISPGDTPSGVKYILGKTKTQEDKGKPSEGKIYTISRK